MEKSPISPHRGAYSPLKPISPIAHPRKGLQIPKIPQFKNDSLSINSQDNNYEKLDKGLRVIDQNVIEKSFEGTGIASFSSPKDKPISSRYSPSSGILQKVNLTAKPRKS